MTPSRVVRVLLAVLLLTAIPSIASAATTEFRVLFDVDNDASTGCTVSGLDGVEQVLVTQVTEGDPMRVTRTHRQLCMGVVLGSPTDINTDGWPAGWNPTNKLLTVETRIPFMAFGAPEMPRDLHVAFDATRTVANHTAFVNADGTAIVIPPPPVRRRAISPDRHIAMNGNLTDWGRITPAVFGVASNGTDTLRLLRILAWPDTNDNHIYFAVTAYLGSDHPWADDDLYQRSPGESLSIGAPGVLDNDGIPGNAPMSAEKVSDPSRGTVTLNADGSFTYSPTHPQLLSSDEFEYKAKAAGKESNVARVIIQVNQNENPNSPEDDEYTTLEDHPKVVPAPGVLDNDPHSDFLVASLFEAPDHGTVVLHADGGFTYTPDDDFFGIDTFVYTATKKQGAPPGIGGNATVTITITPVNDEPSFTPGPSPVTTTASSGPFSQVWATNISAGPNESGQSVNFVVSNNNNPLFSVQPFILPNGTLKFTPSGTQGSAAVSVRLEDNGGTANGGDDTSPTVFFTIIISCGSITVTNPATNTATVGVFFSQTFTQTGAVGGATFTTSSTLPAGLTLATNGTLSGTPTQPGTFPIVVTVTDGTGCQASGPTYNLVVNCQTITVTNPVNANGTAASPFSETFTQVGGNGLTTFSLASGTLPAGLTLAANGVLSGTPTQTGSFPITVMATDANGCTGTGAVYNLVIGCQTITVTNPANGNGTAGSPFSETFTQTGGIGTTNFSLASGTLPAGLTLAANGVLSGTPTQTGSFPITVTATDSNGCTGTGATYTIVIACQTITVNNPANGNGTAGSPFSETFTHTGGIGTTTFSLASGVLPAGLTLAANGVLSGTPTQVGSFPITVTATDSNGCTGTGVTYTITIGCQTITVTNPATTTGTVSSPFSQTFTQTGAIGTATFTTASTLPAGLTLATNGVLSGTPTEDGTFPIVVTVTDSNGCTGTSATYNLVIGCQTITVINPSNATGPAGSPFSETFTQTGAVGSATFTTSSTLPTGLSLSTAGVLSGTPSQGGTFPIVVTVTDANGCTGVGSTYTLVITCPIITVNNPANGNGTANSPFSETFTSSGGVGTMTYTLATGTLPTGLTLAANGVLSGTPTQTGSFPITVTATDSNGCTGTGTTYTIVIACQTITVTNPVNANGTASSPFSETFTQTGGIGTTTFSLATGTLPAGLTLAANGVLSGTPTQTGSFPITVTATDSNGCTGTGSTYTIIIGCQTITVTNPANTAGAVSAPFSETFTQTGAIGTTTFTTASTLPAGLTLATNGVLSGTPLEDGVFPIVVTVTDANSCTGTSATYNLTIGCQTITVTNPVNTGGTVNAGFSETFTQTGAVGGATFTLNSGVLPNGLTLATNGTLSGTPTEDGSFPITVLVTDGNGCTGVSATHNLNIACQTITVTNPANATGPAGSPFSETFTQTGGILPVTFSTASTLPTGLSLSTAGVLSGTPTQGGTFPIVVTVTDANGCTGTSPTYNLIITCPTITVNNPANGNGTANAAFSETFTSSGGVGTMTYTLATGTLPTGLTLAANGVLSGTPTQTGSFPITVTATDSNGCTGTGSTYTITIACQTITVNNPANANGTANSAFSETFTHTGGIGTTTFSLATGTLPAGLTLAANGTLSGTPTQTGSFPITVTATDSNGCTGTGATYNLTIACQVITVNNPANANGTASSPFSETFTATNAIGTTTFSLASGVLPTGLSLAANGTLSGIPTQTGSFPITVTATDANGCTGTSATYNLTIACQTITVTNPANASGTVNAAFSETFTQTGAIGTATFTTASTLPTGLLLATNGTLSGTPTQAGSFPIVVTVTDSNGCTGTSATYNLVIGCQTILVNVPGVNTGTAGTPFSQMFTQTGAVGTATFTTSSTLPAGLVLQTDGTLAGTPTSVGTFPIVVTVTDSNGCTGTSATYNLTISCQTITVTNPATTSVQAGQTLGAAYTFTATGILGTANWTLESGTLPVGITLNATSGQLQGSSTVQGSYPITVRVTDTNGCFDISDTYTLDVVCPVIGVARTGGGAFPAGTFNTAYTGESFAGSGGTAPYTFAVTSGTFPTGLTLATDGTISGTPTQTGTFVFTVTATDASLCPGSQSFSIAINPFADPDTYSNLVNNTQAVVTGTTTAPTTPHVVLSGLLITDDLPSGGVVAVAQTVGTTQGGSVTIAADGSFLYTPPVTVNALATDSFTYTISSNTGGTGTPTTAGGLVTLNLANRVWYVRNNAVAGGDGRSHSPFNSTSGFTNGARATPDKPGDIIFIHRGDGTTTNLTSGLVLLDNEQLIGEGVALVVNTHTLVAAGLQPQLTNSTPGDVIVLGNGNTVRGLTTTGGTNGISGAGKTAFTGGNLTLQNATSSGLVLNTFAGAVTLTNTTITNNAIGVNLAAGTLTFTMDNTNSITANAGQRSINFNALGATAVVTVGTTITDNGTGISVTNSVAGAQVSFTGTQTLSTGGNIAVNLATNTGATITFSGTLGITTTTGSGFTATGGGTLNVGAGASTANVTTGAAGTASVNITGMTIGAGGVTFDSVNATGPATGINVVNNNGTVSVNGGTINNAGNGAHMQGATTNLSLTGVTIGGTTTTGINTTTNFGTLTIGASVNVSAAAALNLNTGAVSGTFNNITSTGGTNGVNLTAVTGTWGATAGALSGATGATFNVTGGSANITWGPTISQANAANVVTIATSNSGIINFNGNVSSTGTSTGLSISGSSGTYNFNGATNTFSGAGGITIGPSESGTITFSNGSTITTAGTAFNVAGGGGAVTAAITYSGTMNKASAGILIAVDNLDTPGTLTMTHAPAATGNLTQNNNGANGISVINSSSTNITISNASVTYNNTAAGFTASGNTGGTINLPGLFLDGNGNKAGMLISGAGTINVNAGAANPTIDLSGGSAAASRAIDGATVAFTGTLNLTNVTITGNANADIVNLGGGTLGGTGSTISGANRALVLSGVALTNGAGMTTVTSSGGANGISLTNVTGGTYTIGGGSLTANIGSTFLVSGGSATFTYNGSMTQTVAQRVIQISGITSGTITLGGAISGTTNSTGVTLGGSGGTVTITGGMTLDGSASTFSSTTAGLTINVTGTNTIGATNAATGPAVNIASATIGGSNVTFRTINSTGGANGIVLNATGNTGSFIVTGNSAGNCGGSITLNPTGTPHTVGAPVTADCTGGTIQTTTGAGISLTNTRGPSFTRIRVLNSGTDGIIANTIVNGLTISNSFITDGAGAAQDRGIEIGDFSTGTAVNGTVTIQNSTVGPTPHDNLGIGIGSGTSTWSITNSVFTGSVQNSGINFEIRNATVSSWNLQDSVIQNQFADGIQMQPASTSTGTITDALIQTTTFSGNNIGLDLNHDGTAAVTYRVMNNTFRTHQSHAANLFSSAVQAPTTGGTLDARFEGNVLGNAGIVGSGSAIGNGIRVNINGGVDAAVMLHNNNIRQTPNGRGIEVISRNGTGTLDVTVTSNNVNPQDTSGFPLAAIFLQSNCITVCNTLRADIRGNTVPVGATTDLQSTYIAMVETGASTSQLVDNSPGSANATTELTEAHTNPAHNNTGSASANAGVALIAGPIDTPL